MPQILIANSLTDGFVVFLTPAHGWSSNVREAAIAGNEKNAGALSSAAALAVTDNIVVDPYLIDVQIKGNEPVPTEYREYIRVYGPSSPIPVTKHDHSHG